MAVMGVSSLLLVAMVVAVAVGVSHNQNNEAGGNPGGGEKTEIKTSSKAVTQICQPTDYKEACERSLTAAAGSNTTSPKDLIQVAFRVAIEKVRKAFDESQLLKEAEKDPLTSKALHNCEELLEYSIDDLRASMNNLGDIDLSKIDDLIEDLKIWLSASMTYQDTCLDGFEGAKGDVSVKMAKAMESAKELTYNALAIVNEISSILTSFNLPLLHRRLLSADDSPIPAWVPHVKLGIMTDTIDKITPNAVVAKDGSGQFKTIAEALATVPQKTNNTFVIYIKEGVYEEQLMIEKNVMNVVMIGDGPTKTKITGSKNFVDKVPTFKTATVAVVGDGFMAKNIGFENSAGAEKHQAVALRVQSDKSIFYNCQMDGYQDTLYAHTHRQFYRECTISGTIDFIFGNSAVVFQKCKMVVRKPMENQRCIVTAQGRMDRREPTGIVLHDCSIVADPAYVPHQVTLPSFLGRPWKNYSRTIIMQTQIDDVIHPDGWLPWEGDFALDTCNYAEFDNRGAGANTAKRVKWKGITTPTMTADRAKEFTVQTFIQGDEWIKPTGVPYTPALLPIGSA